LASLLYIPTESPPPARGWDLLATRRLRHLAVAAQHAFAFGGLAALVRPVPEPQGRESSRRGIRRRGWLPPWHGQSATRRLSDLERAIYEVFATSDGWHPVDQLCEDWLDLARQRGLAVADQNGELPPDVLDAISHTVSAVIWFGLTTGYLRLTGRYAFPASSCRASSRARARCDLRPGDEARTPQIASCNERIYILI